MKFEALLYEFWWHWYVFLEIRLTFKLWDSIRILVKICFSLACFLCLNHAFVVLNWLSLESNVILMWDKRWFALKIVCGRFYLFIYLFVRWSFVSHFRTENWSCYGFFWGLCMVYTLNQTVYCIISLNQRVLVPNNMKTFQNFMPVLV